MAVHNQWQATRATKGGVVAGLVSGVVLMAFLAIMNAIQGRDVLRGLKFAGVPFLGKRALEPGFDHVTIVVGVVDHLAISIFWGVLFALLFYGLTNAMTLLAGAFWGIVVWLGMLYVALPLLGFPPGGTHPIAMAIFTHVLFGVVLSAAFLPFQRELPPVSRHRATPLH
jgi:hypothetical protein